MNCNNPLTWCDATQTSLAAPAPARSKTKRVTARKKAIAQAVLLLTVLAAGAPAAHAATIYFAAAPFNPATDTNAMAIGAGSIAEGIAAQAVGA